MTSFGPSDAQIKRELKKAELQLIYGNLHGFVSEKGWAAIRRAIKEGFDPDVSFRMAESLIPESEFYDIPMDEEEEDE